MSCDSFGTEDISCQNYENFGVTANVNNPCNAQNVPMIWQYTRQFYTNPCGNCGRFEGRVISELRECKDFVESFIGGDAGVFEVQRINRSVIPASNGSHNCGTHCVDAFSRSKYCIQVRPPGDIRCCLPSRNPGGGNTTNDANFRRLCGGEFCPGSRNCADRSDVRDFCVNGTDEDGDPNFFRPECYSTYCVQSGPGRDDPPGWCNEAIAKNCVGNNLSNPACATVCRYRDPEARKNLPWEGVCVQNVNDLCENINPNSSVCNCKNSPLKTFVGTPPPTCFDPNCAGGEQAYVPSKSQGFPGGQPCADFCGTLVECVQEGSCTFDNVSFTQNCSREDVESRLVSGGSIIGLPPIVWIGIVVGIIVILIIIGIIVF